MARSPTGGGRTDGRTMVIRFAVLGMRANGKARGWASNTFTQTITRPRDASPRDTMRSGEDMAPPRKGRRRTFPIYRRGFTATISIQRSLRRCLRRCFRRCPRNGRMTNGRRMDGKATATSPTAGSRMATTTLPFRLPRHLPSGKAMAATTSPMAGRRTAGTVMATSLKAGSRMATKTLPSRPQCHLHFSQLSLQLLLSTSNGVPTDGMMTDGLNKDHVLVICIGPSPIVKV
mmetsp:Transcript_35379/g.85348  ORF Transcript_35379/g.85348 Transcript_35379/m.85348 type:complete len:232 (-) Transcript_35379:86-781(-)